MSTPGSQCGARPLSLDTAQNGKVEAVNRNEYIRMLTKVNPQDMTFTHKHNDLWASDNSLLTVQALFSDTYYLSHLITSDGKAMRETFRSIFVLYCLK